MPTDKFGIPFIYPTKKTKGLTTSGPGFFWEQNNDIFVDHRSGFLRLGKEENDTRVINSSTGEWEFPYLTDGDGLSVSGPTGHHSGGENHGCQGFTYMIDSDFTVNPPSFRFRKETYHVEYDTDPQTGTWTSPLATGPVTNNWKGICWVRYNKKDGRSAGKDSVICEVWWNDNPVSDITNWKMLKRTEDKGQGISNWGTTATCDGDAYQVGTWSNIQFRWKSSSSDFSFHPLKPEFEDGPVIHSIGGEDMSFSDSEARGYGYRSDMPRDIEMKALFKWDGGGDGKCRFKNMSLREIDPTLSFDDDPGTPSPTTTSDVIGTFTVKRDINSLRTSSCEGTPASFGSLFYDSPTDTDGLWSFGSSTQKSRIGILCNSSSSTLANKPPIKKVELYLKKTGSPTGTATCKIRGNSVDKATIGTLDVATLTGSFVLTAFTNTSNTYQVVPGDRVILEFSSGDASNYVTVNVRDTLDITNGNYTKATYFHTGTNTWTDSTSREVAGKLYA